MLQVMAGLTAVDRGTNLELRLWTAVSGTRSVTTTKGAFTEPTGGGYAAIQLPPSALVAAGVNLTTNVAQTFTANASGYSGGPILGWFISTTGATPRVLASETFDSGPYSMVAFATLNVQPSLTFNL
jgi:hypothetical protein